MCFRKLKRQLSGSEGSDDEGAKIVVKLSTPVAKKKTAKKSKIKPESSDEENPSQQDEKSISTSPKAIKNGSSNKNDKSSNRKGSEKKQEKDPLKKTVETKESISNQAPCSKPTVDSVKGSPKTVTKVKSEAESPKASPSKCW